MLKYFGEKNLIGILKDEEGRIKFLHDFVNKYDITNINLRLTRDSFHKKSK